MKFDGFQILLKHKNSFRFSSCSRCLEAGCWIAGLIFSGAFLAHSAAGELQRSAGLANAQAAWAEPTSSAAEAGVSSQADPLVQAPIHAGRAGFNGSAAVPELASTLTTGSPDQSLWSDSRIAAWKASTPQPVLAILEMPSVGLQVPVFEGDMVRGPAWIAGTALPGETGNSGIAGHRDGYFRALKDTEVGASVLLRTAAGQQHYVVDDIRIVDPLDVEVLDPTNDHTITLVTCYPFYFVGSAPQRYIVRARLDNYTVTAYTGEL